MYRYWKITLILSIGLLTEKNRWIVLSQQKYLFEIKNEKIFKNWNTARVRETKINKIDRYTQSVALTCQKVNVKLKYLFF